MPRGTASRRRAQPPFPPGCVPRVNTEGEGSLHFFSSRQPVNRLPPFPLPILRAEPGFPAWQRPRAAAAPPHPLHTGFAFCLYLSLLLRTSTFHAASSIPALCRHPAAQHRRSPASYSGVILPCSPASPGGPAGATGSVRPRSRFPPSDTLGFPDRSGSSTRLPSRNPRRDIFGGLGSAWR